MFNINNYNEQIKNVPQLGVQVFWSLHSERKPKEEVYEALDEAGIPRGYLSEDESVTNFNNAIKSVVSEYGENMGYKRVASDIERITYRVLQFQINKEEEKVRVKQDTIISFNKKRKEIYGSGIQEVIDKVCSRYQYYEDTISDSKVRRVITEYLRKEGLSIRLRPTGGIYFIPKSCVDKIDKVEHLVNSLEIGTVYRMGIVDGKKERKATAMIVEENLRDILSNVRKNILNNENARVKTLTNGIEQSKEVEKLYQVYSEILEGEEICEEIMEACKKLEDELGHKITEIEMSKKK